MKIKRTEGLNIIPLIDVMLVLLAIVLSVSTFIAQGKIPINLPQADNVEQKMDEKKMVILISADNKIYIDDVEKSIDEVKEAINRIDDRQPIEVKSDKDAKFESFVKIIGIIKDKGHENFSISAQSN
ncbi:TonB system transport protein ExbD [Helicobacter fennelliae]|uniref:Biopolymer transport protein ExbD n=2 Tax=Helicobacter fennelliae TaxID=215 RepID=T1DWC7_9HELI|nr:TonB system transport protein ExbD [Helicobacter fennelliae]GAD19312.1 biopolymer transport protein ExbD/TolR [Helicobacter fennelliae MRY12-0050]SQB99086.1 biopolymer transport protein [Helicobacter fennelliae]STP08363.1 biopolymer transport protein [Helicobacter fennelliae]STQ84776.1 biopolymer transport protein [Helicobacter fennelliae]